MALSDEWNVLKVIPIEKVIMCMTSLSSSLDDNRERYRIIVTADISFTASYSTILCSECKAAILFIIIIHWYIPVGLYAIQTVWDMRR